MPQQPDEKQKSMRKGAIFSNKQSVCPCLPPSLSPQTFLSLANSTVAGRLRPLAMARGSPLRIEVLVIVPRPRPLALHRRGGGLASELVEPDDAVLTHEAFGHLD